MSKRRITVATAALVVLAAGVITLVAVRSGSDIRRFATHEIPGAQIPTESSDCSCTERPAPEARYPRFVSARPVYSALVFPYRLTRFGRSSAAQIQGAPSGGYSNQRTYLFALDESHGAGSGYDTLYFDTDGDGNLGNEKPLPIVGGVIDVGGRGTLPRFAEVPIAVDYGVSVGTRPFMLIGCLRQSNAGPALEFRTTRARQARIRFGFDWCTFTLFPSAASGRYDDEGASVSLQVRHLGLSMRPWTTRPWTIIRSAYMGLKVSFRNRFLVHKDWYRFSTTPAGDIITMTPCGRVGKLRFAGSLGAVTASLSLSSTDAILNDAVSLTGDPAERTEERSFPVGDYRLGHIGLSAGGCDARFSPEFAPPVSELWGASPEWHKPLPSLAVSIRAEAPFTITVPGKIDVLIDKSAAIKRLRPGDALSVRAIFVLPETGLVLRQAYIVQQGKAPPSPVTARVIVRNSQGRAVAQTAVTPDVLSISGTALEIPADYKPIAPDEKLTITFAVDLGPVIGKGEASRNILIESPGPQAAP